MAETEEIEIGLHNLKPNPGSRHRKKRVGRGEGSGVGKTSGRGQKGAGARSGSKKKVGHEGGQNPINLVKATIDGLQRLRDPKEVAQLRGLTIAEVLGLDAKPSENGVEAGVDDATQGSPEPALVSADPGAEDPEGHI